MEKTPDPQFHMVVEGYPPPTTKTGIDPPVFLT